MTLQLHVGLPKTGTTAVQAWLIANRQKLAEQQIFTFSDVHLAHRLGVQGITDYKRMNEIDIPPILKCLWDSVEDELKSSADFQSAVISSEYFSVADPRRVAETLEQLGPFGPIDIIVVLRRQDQFVASSHCQDVLWMGKSEPIYEPHYSPNLDWNLLVSHWAEVFGDENIKIVLYETLSRDRPLAPQIFDLDDFGTGPDPQINASVAAPLVEFVRIANLIGMPIDHTILLNASKRSELGGPYRMPRDVSAKWLDFYELSNRILAKRFLHRDHLFDYGPASLQAPPE